jgi:methylphosphotriester-DNA--protein-cysteine methyltransferase
MNRIHFLTQTLEHIDGKLTASLSPATLAQTFGYSRSYLNRLFAETFGQSLGHYIRHRRLAEYLEQIDGMGSGRGMGLVFAASGALNRLLAKVVKRLTRSERVRR